MRLYTSELVKKYKARTVVDHVSIDVNQGEIVGLLGPNGAGKTTTFYMIVGLIKPNEGRTFLENDEGQVAELTNEPVYKRAQMGVGYLAQEASVFRRLSVEDNLRAVLEMTEYSKEYQAERVESLIEEFRLQKVRKSLGIQLSGGERRRTEIARAVAINPAFILLDEPFAGVDPIAVEDIQSIVATLKHKNIGVIITDHNVDETLAITDRTYLLYEGENPQNRHRRGAGRRPDGPQGLSGPALRAEKEPPADAGDEKPQNSAGITAETRNQGCGAFAPASPLNHISPIMDKTVPSGRVKGTLTPPCSKSYAQRALAASLLCEETSVLRNIEFCSDTRSALQCIETLGARVTRIGEETLSIEGGLRPQGHTLRVGESGLSTRLFTPIASLCGTPITIEGEGTLLRRPMEMMTGPLRTLGVRVRDNGGFLPFEVRGPIRGGEVDVDGSVSSQFITGLMLALPLARHDTTIHVRSAVSTPYLDMTIDTAARFGVEICHNDYEEFYIEGGQRYSPACLSIEGDWSAAAMLLVAGAVAGEVTVRNISMLSKQADTAVCTALVRAGAAVINEADSVTAISRPLHGFEFDATNCPDLFPALAALAAAADGVSTIRGTSRLLHKESNRAEAIREEYAKVGIEVDISEEDVMRIRGGKIRPARVSSHDDHRMAMSMAVSALRCDGQITIENAECVAKSYPGFFEDLEKIRV